MEIRDHYKMLTSNIKKAFALHRLVMNSNGEPIDFVIEEVNDKFYDFLGFDPDNIVKKKISEIGHYLDEMDFDWLKKFADIALNGGRNEFDHYSKALNKWFRIIVYSPEKYYFVTLFELLDSIDKDQVIELAAQKNDFRKISDISLSLSRINTKPELFDYIDALFSKEFPETIVIINEIINNDNELKIIKCCGLLNESRMIIEQSLKNSIIGFTYLMSNEFKELYMNNSLIEFDKDFGDFAINVLHSEISQAISEIARIKFIYTIAIKTSSKLLGAIHLFPDKKYSENRINFIEAIVHQFSANLDRITSREKIIAENELFKKGRIVIFKWLNKSDWPVDYVSDNVYDLLGYKDQQFYNGEVKYIELVNKKDLDRVSAEVEDGMTSHDKSVDHTPYRLTRKDGSNIWVSDFTVFFNDKNGNVEYMLGYIYDVTKEKENEIKLHQSFAEVRYSKDLLERAMDELEESELRWKFALEGSNSGVWDWNLKTNEVFFSIQWKKMLGFEEDEIQASLEEWEKRVHPEDLARTYNDIKAHLEGKTEYYSNEHRVLCKDGTYKWILDKGIVVSYDEEGNPTRMVGTHLDLSDRIFAEEKLKKEKDNLQEILKTSLDGFFIVDMQGKFVDANDAYCKMIGYSLDELLKMRIPDVEAIEEEEDTKKHIKLILEQGYDKFITKHISRAGIELDLEVSANLIETKESANIVTFCRDITDQLKSQKELWQSRQQLESFFSQSLDGFFFMMLDEPVFWNDGIDKEATLDYIFSHQRMTKVNLAILEQYVAKEEEFLGLTPNDLFGHDIEQGKKVWMSFFDNGKLHIETKEQKFDGREMWVEGDYVCLYDLEGRVTGHFGIQREITEQKKARQKLIEEEEKFRQLTEHIDEVFWLRNAEDDTIIYVSPAYENIWGRSCQSLYDDPHSFTKSVHPEDKAVMEGMRTDKRYIEQGFFDQEFRIIRPDGDVRWIWSRAFPVRDKDGNMIRRAGIAEDITQRKIMEQKLRDSEERYRGLIESQTDLIVRVDSQNHFTYVNETYCKTFGKTQEELIGKTFTPLVHEDDLEPTLKAMENLTKPPYRATIEQRAMTVNGWRWLAWEDNAILDENNNIIEIQGVGRDITNLKEAEAKALAASKAKSEFLANMSHEIRTPMNSILGFSEILLNTTDNPQHRNYLSTILSSGKTLLSLINDVLDLSKIESGKMEIIPKSINIAYILNEIAGIFSQKVKEKNIAMKITINDGFPKSVEIDEVRFRQILLNIVGNAVKFTHNGEINIIASSIIRSEKNVDVAIEVHDTGIGIDPKLGDEIFNSFTQQTMKDTKQYEGTGLGLSISKKLVDMMNGELFYESEVDKGTIFTVIFKNCPLSEKIAVENDPFIWTGKEIVFNDSKLLVVDDVEYNRDLVKSYLLRSNIEIAEAENGYIALEIVKDFKPDLILMDIRMPEMNGIETTRILKEDTETNHIPIIAFTASMMKREEDKLLSLFDGTLRKPVMKKDLVVALTKYLKHTIKKEFKKQLDLTEKLMEEVIKLPDELKNEMKKVYFEKYENRLKDVLLLMDLEEISSFWDEFSQFCLNNDYAVSKDFCSQMKINIESYDYDEVEKNLVFISKLFEKL
jgi:PAS domain S-box-containing protein